MRLLVWYNKVFAFEFHPAMAVCEVTPMTPTWFRSTLLVVAAAALAACNNTPGLATTPGASNANALRVNGMAYGPATQVAIINSGAFNYQTLARSDEKGAAKAIVKFNTGGATLASAVADDTGAFAVDLPAGVYWVSTTLHLKNGSDATHTGIAVVSSSSTTLALDAANACIAATLQAKGVSPTSLDAAKVQTALNQMEESLSSVSSVPDTTTDANATAAYDAGADAACRATVQALLGG